MDDQARYSQFDDREFAWSGVDPQQYKDRLEDALSWKGVTRHTLFKPDQPETAAFEVRYFEIAPQGYSTLEQHQHVHAVTILRGTGHVLMGTELYPAKPLDFFYIPSGTPHQFLNTGDEPFGFMCVVNAHRDRPRPLTPGQLAAVAPVLAPVRKALGLEL